MNFTLQKNKDRKAQIYNDEPIIACGLTFYPILVEDYADFLMCKDVLTLRLSSLPVEYAIKDYFSALFALDNDAIKNGEEGGFIFRFMVLLCLSLRIDELTDEETAEMFTYSHNGAELQIEKVKITQQGKTVELSPLEISHQIRQVIAQQNGLKLPDESENADIIRANEELKSLKESNSHLELNPDCETLIASVALITHTEENILRKMTVRRFESKKNAIDRVLNHIIFTHASMSGMVSFKNGNPYPHWGFDLLDNSLGTMAMADFQKKIN